MYNFKVYLFNFSFLFSCWKSKFLNTYLNTCIIQWPVWKCVYKTSIVFEDVVIVFFYPNPAPPAPPAAGRSCFWASAVQINRRWNTKLWNSARPITLPIALTGKVFLIKIQHSTTPTPTLAPPPFPPPLTRLPGSRATLRASPFLLRGNLWSFAEFISCFNKWSTKMNMH